MTLTDAAPAAAPPAAPTGASAARSEADSRSNRRERWFLVVVAIVVIGAIALIALARESRSAIPLAPDNPDPSGAQAVATILGDQGVRIETVWTTDSAISAAGPGTTLLVTSAHRLTDEQLTAVRETGADIVLTQFTFLPELTALTDRVESSTAGSTEELTASCADPHAQAAGTIVGSTGAVLPRDDDVELCFPTADGAGALATWQEGSQRFAALADPTLLNNERLADAGHAALALRLLGAHEQLVWYLPSIDDPFGQTTSTEASPVSLVPETVRMVGLQLLVVVGVVLLWGARRLGRVVTEPMPVVVRAAETTLGRGRLYRRAGDHAHAAAGLRAGSATRLAGRLGLPHSTSQTEMVGALSRASGRDEAQLHALLYGPPPHSDADLIRLTRELDTLESEVHPS